MKNRYQKFKKYKRIIKNRLNISQFEINLDGM